MKKIAFILITIIFHSYIQECLSQCKYTINVLDAETQTSTTNILFRHSNSKMKFRSNENGIIEIKQFPNGINKFVVMSPLYYPDTLELGFPIVKDSLFVFKVRKVNLNSLLSDTLKSSVVIQVLDKETNEPLPWASVCFQNTSQRIRKYTDKYGIAICEAFSDPSIEHLSVEVIPNSDYKSIVLYFDQIDYKNKIVVIHLSKKPIDESEIDYMPYVYKSSFKPDTSFFQNQFYCQIVDYNDRPLPGINIEIKELKISDKTNSKGEFRLDLIPNGIYLLKLNKYPLVNAEVPIVLNNGKAWTIGEDMYDRIYKITSNSLTLEFPKFRIKIQEFY